MKKEEKTELTKNKIYAAAIQEFGTKGYVAGAINNICKSGINKGLIYHNFKDKDDLYLACVQRSCDHLLLYVSGAMKNVCFVEYMSARMRFFTEYEMEAAVFLEARTNPPKHLEKQISKACSKFDELNKEVFEKELGCVELRAGVSREDALHYFFDVQKIYNFNFTKKFDSVTSPQERIALHEANIKKTFDLLLYGIAKGGRGS